MENELVKYISKYMELPVELKLVIVESTVIHHHKKGKILLTADQVSKEGFIAFILATKI